MKWEGWLRKEAASSELLVRGTDQMETLSPELKAKVVDLMKCVIGQIEKRTALGVTIEEQHGEKSGQTT